jgi:hypothetical protein
MIEREYDQEEIADIASHMNYDEQCRQAEMWHQDQ